MGVDNLWLLLDSAGTKITIESLATRKLAVDASLWLVQFIKAMRDPNGEMIDNCHLLGLFRRVCKLLFYNIRPVFVFDGPAPRLKRKTLKQRQIRREKNSNDIKKMAERLLLNRCQMAAISLSKKQLQTLQKQRNERNKDDDDDSKENNHNHKQHKKSKKQKKKKKKKRKKKKKSTTPDQSARIQDAQSSNSEQNDADIPLPGGFIIDDSNNQNEEILPGGFLMDDIKDNDIEILNKDNDKKRKKKSDKEEMSDDDSENEDIASRPLQHNKSEADLSDNDGFYEQIKTTNKFHKFPADISQMTAEDIAELPASMQYEIMSKRRELLRAKTRPQFVEADKIGPSEYAQVQLKNFIKTSSLNMRIEKLRKKTVDEYHKELLADEGGANDDIKQGQIQRIASEGDKLFWVKEIEQNGKNKNFRHQWMDKQTKQKKIEYLNKSRRKKRNSKWGISSSDYIARTLDIEVKRDVDTSQVKGGMFENWSCPVCKYLNLKQRRKCDVCGIIRDEALKKWKCPQCTYCNEGRDKICKLCDTVNPEGIGKGEAMMFMNPRIMLGCDEKVEVDECSQNVMNVEDENVWICAVCSWKNSHLFDQCSSCNKMKKQNDESIEKGQSDDGNIGALELMIDNDDGDESLNDLNVEKAMNEKDVMVEDESDSDGDLLLSAPALTLDLSNDFDNDQIETHVYNSPEKIREVSPSKSTPSQISQMVNSNDHSLLNMRDSMQNFYNITRLTQQSNILSDDDSVKNMNETAENININDDDIEIMDVVQQKSNDSDIEIQPLIIEQKADPIPVTPVSQSKRVQSQNNVEIMEVSDHDSDNDIIAQMDVTPGNFKIDQMKKMDKEQTEDPLSSPQKSVDKIPSSFVFEIPTFEQVAEAEKLEMAQLNPTNQLQHLSDHDEEDEKLPEISDPSKMSHSLSEISQNQASNANASQIINTQISDADDNDILMPSNDENNEHKPLKRRKRKRKLDNADNSNTPSPKKQKTNNEQPQIPSINRNIGLNESQIQNSLQKLYNMEDNIIEENILLNQNAATALRNSEHVTPEMIDECRSLLDMFGIPYITSPSEAEAQCAELNKLGLVDGIITDDSDVFLFGGCTIYKHMFHLNKYVEKYSLRLLESKLGLSQNKLIAMAMLLGSDYTDGIKGIGPVNGIEIVQTFCSESDEIKQGLEQFKQWIYSPDIDKKPNKKSNLRRDGYDEYIKNKRQWFKYKHRNVKKHWFVPREFPDDKVMDGYLRPNVDSDEAKFELGKPDIEKLKSVCREKFRWDERTINLTLDPIAKVVENGRGSVQSSILNYADWIQPNKKAKSQRIQKAVKSLIDEIALKKQMDEEIDSVI